MRTDGKVDRKYYVLIWVALILSCFMRNAYQIYLTASEITDPSRMQIMSAAARIIFAYGAVPAAIVFICALVIWQIGFRRYVRCVPRNDFCYIIMLSTSAVYFFVGIIEVFSILEPNIYLFTSTVLDAALLPGVFIAIFYFVFTKKYKFNPVEKYNAYKLWFTIYMVFAGISVIGENGLVLMLADNTAFSQDILTLLYSAGYYIFVNDIQVGMSITAICIYVVYLVAVIVLGERIRKEMQMFRHPETRGDYYEAHENRPYNMRTDAGRVFDESSFTQPSSRKEDEHVFDEFDL